MLGVGLGGAIFLQKFWLSANSLPFIKSRKEFDFQVDPYSGDISCSYRDVAFRQHGF